MTTRGLRRLVSAFSVFGLLIALLALVTPRALATTGPLVYGINPYDNSATIDPGNGYSYKGLRPFDASTGLNAPGFVITNAGGPVTGAVQGGNALAHDPASGNDYAVLRLSGHSNQRVLATINLSNGQATTIAVMGVIVSAITFATDGTMYGVEGNQTAGDNPVNLYQINKADGSAVSLRNDLVNDCCGQGLAYNPDDDMLYHTNGHTSAAHFERISRTFPYAVTPIGYTGGPPDEVYGVGFDAVSASHRFIMTDSNEDVWSVTSAGAVTALPSTNSWLRGLIVTATAVPSNGNPSANNDSTSTVRGGATTISVLANDTDPEDDPISISSFSDPPHGTVTQSGKKLVYQADAGYCDDSTPDSFTYTINGGATATVTVTVLCQQRYTIFGGDRGQGILRPFDLVTGQTLPPVAVTTIGGPVTGTVTGVNGLAFDPRSRQTFGMLQVSGAIGRVLAKIDLATGSATTIRDTKHAFSAITATSKGALFGVIGQQSGEACPNCLYKISKSTGKITFLKHLTNSYGNALAYDPVDHMLYHATGCCGNEFFEKVDPAHNFKVTGIGYSGTAPSQPFGMVFDPQSGNFLLSDAVGAVWSVTSAGATTFLTNTEFDERGLVPVTDALTLKYIATKHVFRGRIISPWPDCFNGRTVSIIRDSDSADIGDVVSAADGTFSLKIKAHGLHHAHVDDDLLTGAADCPAADSRSIKA
jgi:hypothetical protein